MSIWPPLALVFALVVWAEASPTYSQTPLRLDGGETLYARSIDLIRFNVTSTDQKLRLLELAKVMGTGTSLGSDISLTRTAR
jgi:hypothetical protein